MVNKVLFITSDKIKDSYGITCIIGADWLIYQDLADLVRAVRHHDSEVAEFDTSCFSGDYVTSDVTPEYLARLQAERSDQAKAQRNASGAGRGALKVVGSP
jgi:amidophosphoribosyltransferase